MTIPAGNPLTFTVTFRDAAGHPVDPASGISVRVETPDGTQTTYAYPADGVTHDGTGVYSKLVEGVRHGRYWGRGQGVLSNGLQVTTEDESVTLSPSRFLG